MQVIAFPPAGKLLIPFSCVVCHPCQLFTLNCFWLVEFLFWSLQILGYVKGNNLSQFNNVEELFERWDEASSSIMFIMCWHYPSCILVCMGHSNIVRMLYPSTLRKEPYFFWAELISSFVSSSPCTQSGMLYQTSSSYALACLRCWPHLWLAHGSFQLLQTIKPGDKGVELLRGNEGFGGLGARLVEGLHQMLYCFGVFTIDFMEDVVWTLAVPVRSTFGDWIVLIPR